MKVLCDVHIPLKLVYFCQKHSVEALHVNSILDGYRTTDNAIAAFADENKMIVITKDIDFRNSYFLSKTPKRLLRICLGNVATSELLLLFGKHLNLFKKTYDTADSFYIELSQENTLIVNP